MCIIENDVQLILFSSYIVTFMIKMVKQAPCLILNQNPPPYNQQIYKNLLLADN